MHSPGNPPSPPFFILLHIFFAAPTGTELLGRDPARPLRTLSAGLIEARRARQAGAAGAGDSNSTHGRDPVVIRAAAGVYPPLTITHLDSGVEGAELRIEGEPGTYVAPVRVCEGHWSVAEEVHCTCLCVCVCVCVCGSVGCGW
jgi:hypothetical protein